MSHIVVLVVTLVLAWGQALAWGETSSVTMTEETRATTRSTVHRTAQPVHRTVHRTVHPAVHHTFRKRHRSKWQRAKLIGGTAQNAAARGGTLGGPRRKPAWGAAR